MNGWIVFCLLLCVGWMCPHAKAQTDVLAAQNPLAMLGADFTLTSAASDVNDQLRPPADHNFVEDLELPSWYGNRPDDYFGEQNYVWFRARLTPAMLAQLAKSNAPNQTFGVYLGRHLMSLEVYAGANAEHAVFVGATGDQRGYGSRNWNESHLFQLPFYVFNASSERAQGTAGYLYFRLYGYDQRVVMPPIILGDALRLQELQQRQHFRQVSLSRMVWSLELAIVLTCGLMWWRTRQLRYFWLMSAALLSSIGALYSFSQAIPIHQNILLRVVHWSADAGACAMCIFARSLFARRRTWFDTWLSLFPLITLLTHALAPNEWMIVVFNLIHLIPLASMLVLMFQALRIGYREREPAGWIFAAGVFVVVLSFAHGVSLSVSDDVVRWAREFHTMYLSMLPMFVMFLVYMSRRFIESIDNLGALNQELSMRVDLMRAELAATHSNRLRHDRELAAQQARETAFRDLHDDLGARLLSLVYSATDNTRADMARSALQDLRDVVRGVQRGEASLEEALADCRYELADRSQRLNAVVHWESNDIRLLEVQLTSTKALYLKQFFREVGGAILVGSGARDVTLMLSGGPRLLLVQVASQSLCVDDQRRCLSSHLLLRVKKLSGRVQSMDTEKFNIRFLLPL